LMDDAKAQKHGNNKICFGFLTDWPCGSLIASMNLPANEKAG
jgi:hypothetical protein